MKIVLAADHGGFLLKEIIKEKLLQSGRAVVDVGCDSVDSVDYPDYAEKAVSAIVTGACDRGILVCGTGIGMSIAANRHRNIRAANCFDVATAILSREHNNANILCLGARVLDTDNALQMVMTWLDTEFSGGRHQQRVAKFSA
ncbi:ribose 5-phosphate isomerase B [Desulfopila sp. IMCC35006]|uniref:ribose 5-phosphate isomerase B n=1 Tax=Desulfopila sp. IMCC35006 TaxID=2569542 RepID=UPI0010ABABFD|nr:ribose 5-phosphate isomerase B [Desulfopila sp. IMCC35006]TKB28105.1 ribose 5-phosphate isomerase B [Desulfopila sp. IMCC35006]